MEEGILNSWKEISSYLCVTERTAQRYIIADPLLAELIQYDNRGHD